MTATIVATSTGNWHGGPDRDIRFSEADAVAITAAIRSDLRGGWNATLRSGVVVGLLCPGCQTPEENAEAEINEATLDYGRDERGRVTGHPRVVA